MSVSSTAACSPIAASVPRPASDLHGFVEDALAAVASGERTALVSMAAPRVEPEALLDVCRRPWGVVWDPPRGASFSGVGAAHVLRLCGERRFEDLRRRADEIFARLAVSFHPDGLAAAPAPRLYGGLAFDVGAADGEPWREFGDGCFTLPRLAYRVDGASATLTLAVRGEELAEPGAGGAWAAEMESVLARLGGPRDAIPTTNGAPLRVHRPSRRGWTDQVEAIRAAIDSGAFAKIVAAGCSRAELARPLAASAVLRRVSRGLVASTRFAFCRRHSAFLGATPERLISRRGPAIETEALAGSIASGGERAARLLASRKDQREHQLVTDEIVRRLRPLCAELEVARQPRVMELRDVLHLHTPVAGTLRAPRHVLELVEELHPTPAVGGVPTEEAVRWIAEHEPGARGWYAAPIGWFDAAGDGDFAVALRSCVVSGREAFLFAGAGIVRASSPELEYTETELKKQALLPALGG